MTKSIKRELEEIVLVIVLAAIATVALQFILEHLDVYFPSLAQYVVYIAYAINAIIIFGFAVLISNISKNALHMISTKVGGRNLNGVYTLIRALIYGVAIVAFLLTLGYSLTGALLGGTVGGLIISFALQNTITSVLSGLLLSSSGVIKPMEPVYVYSWMFDNPVIGMVEDIKVLTTQVRSVNGLTLQLPSTVLLSQAQFTNLTYKEDKKLVSHYTLLGFAVDVPVWEMMEEGNAILEKEKDTVGLVKFHTTFQTKGFNTNTLKVVFVFKDISRYNDVVNLINVSYEKAYWNVKTRITPQPQK